MYKMININRSIAVALRVAQNIRNDRRMIALIFLAPVVAMLLFGYSFGGTLKNAPLIVVSNDTGYVQPSNHSTIYISKLILQNLNENPDNVSYRIIYMTNLESAMNALREGKAYAVIVFPENISKQLLGVCSGPEVCSGDSIINLYVDNSNIVGGDSTVGAVQDAALVVQSEFGLNRIADHISVVDLYGSVSFMDYFLPGVISFAVFLLPTKLTLISFVEERSRGTLERLLSTPATPGEVVLGYALTLGLVAIMQSIILIVVGIVVFGIIIRGSVLLLLLTVTLLALSSQSIGILLSTLARRETQAVQLIPFIVLPALLLTSVLRPIQELPGYIQPFSYLLPPTYAVDALRSVMIKGSGITVIWPELFTLVIFSAFPLYLASYVLKRESRS